MTASGRAAPLPREQHRAAILAAVLPLLVDRGTAVTSRELAAAANVAEGTIFKVFDDKGDLLTAALAVAADPEPFEHALAGIDPTVDFRARLTEATALLQHRMRTLWRLVGHLEPAKLRHHDEYLPHSPAFVALLATGAEQLAVTPERAADVIRSSALGLANPVLVRHPPSSAEIVDLVLDGIAAQHLPGTFCAAGGPA